MNDSPSALPLQATQVRRAKISQDLRERLLNYLQTTPSATISSAGRIFGIAVSTATAIVRKHQSVGSLVSATRGGAHRLKITQQALDLLSEWTDQRPDSTLNQLKTRLGNELNILVTEKTISRALTKIGFTMKILRTIPVSRNCPETVLARTVYAQRFLEEAPADHKHIVWVDECGFNLHLRRKFGRARKGELATVTVANGRGRNISLCAAMSEEGFLLDRLKPGAYNAEEFILFLQELFEVLTRLGRDNCWIICDNASFHHTAAVLSCVNSFGHQLVFLPPYSPMLNPIESLFGKWKTLIRTQLATMTQEALLEQMAISRAEISQHDCLGWIRDMNRNIGLSLQRHIFE
jgi:transposase